jgi:isocitrate/isopropylmalate dehydrogenase
MTHKILILPGDGIGPEIVTEAVKLLDTLRQSGDLAVELEHAEVGGAGVDAWSEACVPSRVCCASAPPSAYSPTCVPRWLTHPWRLPRH